MTIHLIRHGITIANENRLYCGFSDVSLSEQGIDELLKLKEQGIYPAANLFIVSGLARTVQTMNILYDNPTFKIIKDLKEMNFGVFEMRGHEELTANPAYQNWLTDIENVKPPNGERKADFIKRVIKGFSEARYLGKLQASNSTVIVTHGGVIATIMEFLCPKQKNFYEWQPKHGRGYKVSLECTHNIHYSNI